MAKNGRKYDYEVLEKMTYLRLLPHGVVWFDFVAPLFEYVIVL